MAYIIGIDGNLNKLEPKGDKFNVEEIKEITNGWFLPDKVGPIWVIVNENLNLKKDKDFQIYNERASSFFLRDIFGQVLIMSSHELPAEWDITDELDENHTQKEIEEGFLNLYKHFMLSVYPQDSPFISGAENLNFSNEKKQFYFRPDQVDITNAKKPDDFRKFLMSSYDFIVNSSEKDESIVMLEDEFNVIKIETKPEQIKAIDQVIQVFEEKEEYEKCSKLSNVRGKIQESIK